MILLETDRLRLRAFTEADAADLVALDSDPEVMRYIGHDTLPTLKTQRERIVVWFLPYYQCKPGLGFWVAEEKGAGTFLGWFHLRPALDFRFAAEAGYGPGDHDIGYRLKRAAWGQGLATEGALALLQHGFLTCGIPQVVSCALEGNRASIRVMEKIGLKFVGTFALPGYDQSLVKYALPREHHRVE